MYIIMIKWKLLTLCFLLFGNRIYCTDLPYRNIKPRFESDWYELVAQDRNKSQVTIPHDLGEYPVKVDVQVKVTVNGTEYIFTGIGSAHRDDDFVEMYGATVYIYNKHEVIVTAPLRASGNPSGGIAYAGTPSLYEGPHEIEGPYFHGFVKVRTWKASDMPPLLFNLSVDMDTKNIYKEISHNLGLYPDIVSVQTLLPNGYISDGQGSVLDSRRDSIDYDTGWLVYGYDSRRIKLWASDKFLFSTKDGWGHNQSSKTGTVLIFGWKLDDKLKVYRKSFTTSKTLMPRDVIPFPWSFDFSNYLVSVMVKISKKNDINDGMVFTAEGSSMAKSSPFGGIIYVYTTEKLLLYQPYASEGHLIYIGGASAYYFHGLAADEVEVEVVVYHLSGRDLNHVCYFGTAIPHYPSKVVPFNLKKIAYREIY